MSRAELLALAERVEGLTGPDVCTAKAIFAAVYPEKVPFDIVSSGYGWREDSAGWWLETGEDSRNPRQTIYPPNWLGSLDAAMSLVPKGWTLFHLDGPWNSDPSHATVANGDFCEGQAATPALALTAAALRALAEQQP